MSWDIGLSTGACTDRPITDLLPALRAAGVMGVEVGTPPRHFDPWREDQIDAAGRMLRSLELEAVSIHAPFGGVLDLADPNPHHRHAAIGAALTAALALKQLGGRLVVVHPSDLPRDQHDVRARLADCSRSLALLAENCGHAGLQLIVESPLPHLIGGAPDEFAELLANLPTSAGVCLDTGHLSLGGHWLAFVRAAGSRLRHVHANDNHGHRDDHLPPGLGRIEWAMIASSLRDAGFKGWVMLELACPGLSDTHPYFAGAIARARALFAA